MAIQSVIVLVRHGETEWSKSGQHTGLTDLPLTGQGEADAAALAPVVDQISFGKVLISPLQRARRTAELAGLVGVGGWTPICWNGTTAPMKVGDPLWTIWRDPILPGEAPGEQPEDVADHCRKVIESCLPVLESGEDCALVAHGHLLRIFAATWLDLPAVGGRLFALSAGALSRLGYEHEQHVIRTWNAKVPALRGSAEHH